MKKREREREKKKNSTLFFSFRSPSNDALFESFFLSFIFSIDAAFVASTGRTGGSVVVVVIVDELGRDRSGGKEQKEREKEKALLTTKNLVIAGLLTAGYMLFMGKKP